LEKGGEGERAGKKVRITSSGEKSCYEFAAQVNWARFKKREQGGMFGHWTPNWRDGTRG